MQASSESNLSHVQCQILYCIPELRLAVSMTPLECSWLNPITPVLQTLGCSAASPPGNSADFFLGWHGRTCPPPQPPCLPPQMASWWVLRELRKKEYLPSSSHQTAATHYSEPWGSSGGENRILAPDSEVHINRMISVSPDPCIQNREPFSIY